MVINQYKFYKHKHGGIYKIEHAASMNVEDQSDWVVYTHVWPFDMKTYHRRVSEFTDGRFTEIDTPEYLVMISKSRREAQAEITAAKVASKRG